MSEQPRTTEGVEESRWLFDQGPYYDPPYDSPIEDQLAYHIVKYLKTDAEFVPQYEVRTFCATYRLDFRLAQQNSVIGIECDGAKYHDRDKDRIRDTLILGSGAVHTIFRLNGRNIINNLNDCLWLIAQFRPQFFSARKLTNLDALVSDTTRNAEHRSAPFVVISHVPKEDDDEDDRRPWEIHLDVRGLWPTKHYFYMFQEFWDIIKRHKLHSIKQIEDHFRDIPAIIDAHFSWQNTLSDVERRNYQLELKRLQAELYPKPR